jgi:phosphatidylinositol-3,4,5-trisphosphate 3-phosphatase and dual-specificity protein phosphatase PTEN
MESIGNLIRTQVSGKRRRLINQDFNLDLTAITPRIYAMSFPASTFTEMIYRNSIHTVAEYIEKHHKNKSLVMNLSNKEYDKTPFGGRVLDFEWEDHHSPTLALLVGACSKMLEFLSSDPENVCFVHCNAGKGRTGTLICCYLMFCNFVENA